MCKISLFTGSPQRRKRDSISACVIYFKWWSDLLAMNHSSALTCKALGKSFTYLIVRICYFSNKIMSKGFKS